MYNLQFWGTLYSEKQRLNKWNTSCCICRKTNIIQVSVFSSGPAALPVYSFEASSVVSSSVMGAYKCSVHFQCGKQKMWFSTVCSSKILSDISLSVFYRPWKYDSQVGNVIPNTFVKFFFDFKIFQKLFLSDSAFPIRNLSRSLS